MDMGSLRDYATILVVIGSLTGNFSWSLLRNHHIRLIEASRFKAFGQVRGKAGRLSGKQVT
jgi:hypothetical protein